MGPGTGGSIVRREVAIRATYSLMGSAAGAPRTITYWRLGPWLRAEQDGRVLWLDGPTGVMAGLTSGSLTRIEDGALFRHPVPELGALESVDHAAAWLGIQSAPSGRASETHQATGVRCLVRTWPDRLRVAADQGTGFVLDLSGSGLRGPVAIHTTAFELLAPDSGRFLVHSL